MSSPDFHGRGHWALILGGSSGFGLATARKLAQCGMNVCVVHRDRKGMMAKVEEAFAPIRGAGVQFLAVNTNALAREGRVEVQEALSGLIGSGKVRLLLHSIALGNLKLVAPPDPAEAEARVRARSELAVRLGVQPDRLLAAVHELFDAGVPHVRSLTEPPPYDAELLMDDEDMAGTIYAMGTSLLTWVQDLHARKLFAPDARVLAMTSEGNTVAWRGYAAVSAAKVALEAVARSLAVEFAPHGIRTNIIQAGVTDTPALRLIPGNDQLRAQAALRNPFRRLTMPEDVAGVIALLATDEAAWVNGAIIRVDGGEHIAG